MVKAAPTSADINEAISGLWDVIRAAELIKRSADDIAIATNGDVNAQAEGISGTVALAVTQIRKAQVLLGDPE